MIKCPKCGCYSYEITEKLYDIVLKKWFNTYKCTSCKEEFIDALE